MVDQARPNHAGCVVITMDTETKYVSRGCMGLSVRQSVAAIRAILPGLEEEAMQEEIEARLAAKIEPAVEAKPEPVETKAE